MTVESPPRPPDQDELRALIEEAHQRAHRRRRRYAIVLLVAALAGVGVYVLLAKSAGGPARPFRSTPRIGPGAQRFRPGQFWYTRTISTQHEWLPAGGTLERPGGYFHPIGPEVLFDLRISDETWVGVDGTMRERMIVAGARFASAAGRAQWERTRPVMPPHDPWLAAAYRRPMPDFNHVWLGWMSHDGITVGGDRFPPGQTVRWGEWLGPNGWDVGDGLFSYRQLVSLPTRPTALRARLREAGAQLAQREVRIGSHPAAASRTDAFGELTDIASLLTSPVPAAVRLALFRAAITMPGTRVNRHARDSLGRPGIAVSTSAGLAFQRLIFNPMTGALLADAPDAAVVAQEVVNSAYALPKGVHPIRPAGVPPQPQTPAISPAVGNPTTVFRVKLPSPANQQSRPAPVLDWLLLGTPALRCFAGFPPQLPPLVASSSERNAGTATYVYRLGPANAARRGWCPGRYELIVLPDHSRRPLVSQLPQSTSPDYGSSIFFQVRSERRVAQRETRSRA
jgi:hypothetical protein